MAFLDRFLLLAQGCRGYAGMLPGSVIEQWRGFVNSCREGYGLSLFEYWDEMSVRDFLQEVMEDSQIRETPELVWFMKEVGDIDSEFREILNTGFEVDEGERWWRRHIPGVAGEDMARDVLEMCGHVVEVI